MKTLKSSIVLILISFFSFNSFSQNKHVLSHKFALAKNDLENNRYMVNSPYIVDTDIFFNKDSIILNDGFGSKFKIIRNGNFDEDCYLYESFYCKDNEGDFCMIYNDRDSENNLFYVIEYQNISYIYYTKNN